MKQQPKIGFVFDRRKKATSEVTAMVELRVYYDHAQTYLSTGIALNKGQWKDNKVVNRGDSVQLNAELAEKYMELTRYINSYIKENDTFSLAILDERKGSMQDIDAVQAPNPFAWMAERLATRQIRENTRRNHERTIKDLQTSGIFHSWADFTPANIMRWDDRLKERLKRQTSIHCYHKRLKMFMHEAEIFGLLKQDPYKFVKIEAGHSEGIKYLTKAERTHIEKLELEGPEDKARDLFIFACYTGLSFCDMQKIRLSDIQRSDGHYFIEDKRQKTGTKYHIVLLPQAMEILKKYKFDLRILTNQKANWYLKTVQAYANIKTRLTMHVGRHTFATWALSEGVPIETVSKMLAHSNIQVTQIYAKVLPTAVTDAFELLRKNA